ncbi:restriction endonuclease subunit S [Hymenobacter fodinae]|uniref:Restriction endonuclease subunit S n=1 Tax=Hymenobacter fodinae TaxID=2510796 RepID=A0A4Z0P0H5_9BACT|nr:restriction endonuclease subunit S [Hymenobacter fodinae]TGE04645.1 restriction endonuclease subunit S [Hymenobacter fodinae]
MATLKNFAVEELFTPTRGKSKYTRGYADKHPGEYPVYSAALEAPLCYIDHYDYDGTYLTWTANGYGGRIQIKSGKFSINGDRGILIPVNEDHPNLDYIKYFLQPVLIGQAVGRVVDGKKNEYTKVGPEVVANSIITLPVNEEDNIDHDAIHEKGEKIKQILALQDSMKKQVEQLDDAEIVIEVNEPSKTINLGDTQYFTLSIGDRVLIKDGLGEGVPAYSANVKVPISYIAESNLSDFDRPSILWGIDNTLFFYNIIPENVVFATTDHCGRALINVPDLDAEYVYYYLQATRLEYGFDRVFRSSLENMRSIVEIKVPLDEKGNFSLKRQKEIAERYKRANALKESIIEKLDVLQSVAVDINQ